MTRTSSSARAGRAGGIARSASVALLAAGAVVAATHTTGTLEVAGSANVAGRPQQSTAVVDEATLACPGQERLGGAGLRDVYGTTVIGAAAPPLSLLSNLTLPASRGAVAVQTGGPGGAVASIGDRSDLLAWSPTEATPVMVKASNAMAPGLIASQTWMRLGDDDRGLALTPCSLPASDVWLVGGGAGASRTERIVIGNAGGNAVSVSFDVFGAKGQVASAEARTVSIPPRSRAVVSLDAIAPDEPSPAVHVVASGGVVTAVLSDAWIDGATARGIESATKAAAPSSDLVIAGVEISGVASLRIANPGSAESLTQVRVLTATGPTQPPALRAIRVPARSTVDVPLALPTAGYGLHLVSDHPVVASAYVEKRVASGDDRMGDFGWAVASPALRGLGGAVLAGLDRPGSLKTLSLAAGATGGPVTVVIATGSQQQTVQTAVAADSVATIPLGQADRVWVLAPTGDLHAAVSVVGLDRGAPYYSVATIANAAVSAVSLPVRQVTD